MYNKIKVMKNDLRQKQQSAIKQSRLAWRVADGCGQVSTLFLAAATIFAIVGYTAALVSDKKTGKAKKLYREIKEQQ